MPLTSHNFPIAIDTSDGNPIDDFFIPALREAIQYDAGVGYFTSNWVKLAAQGVAALAEKGGKARWLISPKLPPEDWEALRLGQEEKSKAAADRQILMQIAEIEQNLETDTRNAIAWMISDGLLEFRVALLKSNLQGGDFHPKLGYFVDEVGNTVAFDGSYNLTEHANVNWESLSIFCDWENEVDWKRANDKKARFSRIWDGEDPNVLLTRISSEVVNRLRNMKGDALRPYGIPPGLEVIHNAGHEDEFTVPEPQLPDWLEIRDYQREAVNRWFHAKGRGCFNMATGTGKTITALIAATKLYERKGELATIIVCPFRHLVTQWETECRRFGFNPILCFQSRKSWLPQARAEIVDYNMGSKKCFTAIVTNATFSTPHFQQTIAELNSPSVIIADEMHNLGSKRLQKGLSDNIDHRMGLSATPRRHFDDAGTAALFTYFGEEVFEYSLSKAIFNGYLSRYYYYPHLIRLESTEEEEYVALSKKIGRAYAGNQDSLDDSNTYLSNLLIQRARIIANARNKAVVLESFMSKIPSNDHHHTLVYVGDGKHDDVRQVDHVVQRLGRTLGIRVHPFTANESLVERERIVGEFKAGSLQALVAIRCLDEGVDIPAIETAYILASSSNPKQFIQRRGRVLRKAPGKQYAQIHDFIVVPPGIDETFTESDQAVFRMERSLVKKELARFDEFALLAENTKNARTEMELIKRKFKLDYCKE